MDVMNKILRIIIEIIIFLIMLMSINVLLNIKKDKKQINKYNIQYYNQVRAEEISNDINFKNIKYNDIEIPVLMYHSISENKNRLFIQSKQKFIRDMKYLVDNEFNTITMDELYDFIIYNKPVPKKPVLITFDDGYVDNYNIAYPILKEFNLKATIFVVTDFVDKGNNFLSIEQMKEMLQNGIDIQSHTKAHEKLNKLSYEDQFKTLKESKYFLEQKLNKKVRYIAYPYGKYNIDTLKAAKEAGYVMAFTTEGSWTSRNNGILTLNRVLVSGMGSLKTFDYKMNNPNYKFQYWPF